MSNRRKIVAVVFGFLTLILFVFLFPALAFAQSPLVPCGLATDLSDQCQLCHLVELVQRVINFIVLYLAAPAATLLIAWAGIRLMVYAENETERTAAKQLLKDILVGFLWILFAWTLVIIIMNALVKDNNAKDSKWYKIDCAEGYGAPNISLDQYQGGGLDVVPVRPGENVTCTSCKAIPNGIPIKSTNACATGYNCQISSEIVLNVLALNSQLQSAGIDSSEWQITEAWPPTGYTPTNPTGIHQARCHGTGTCIDANLTIAATADNIKTFSEAADKSGMRAVYEVKTQAEADALKKQLPASVNVAVVSGITAPHFSVYKR